MLADSNRATLGAVTTQPFDEVRIVASQPVNVTLGPINVYNLILTKFCATPLSCNGVSFLNTPDFPVYVDKIQTGVTGAACLLCAVANTQHAISAPITDYTQLTTVAGVLSDVSIGIKNGVSKYPAGTLAGFAVKDPNNFLEVSLLKTITISTYNNGVLQESASSGNILDLSAIILSANVYTGAYSLGIRTTLPYDEIKISARPIVGVAPVLNVYGAFVDTRFIDSLPITGRCPKSPIAEPDHIATIINLPVTGNLKTNDHDPNGLALTYNTVPNVSPLNGTVVINQNGTFTYTPNLNFIGVDSFAYTVCNDSSLCVNQFAFISVLPVRDTAATNHPPLAQDDLSQTIQGVPVTGNAKCNDSDPDGDSLSYSVITQPAHGVVTVSATGAYIYTPDSSFIGVDTAKLQVCDNGTPSLCTTSQLLLQVNPDLNGTSNDPPFAQDDVANTPILTLLTGNVLNNDSDPNGDPLTVSFLDYSPLSNGIFTYDGNGNYSFIPALGYTGTFSLRYMACDPDGLCDTATLTITVQPIIMVCLKARAYLEGALLNANGTSSTGRPLMRDDLRNSPFTALNYIPVQDPYEFATTYINVVSRFIKAAPQNLDHPLFQHVTDSLAVFSVTGQNAIVDWVFIELRNKVDSTSVVATRAGLLQRDGDIVEVDGSSCLSFPGLHVDSYFVAIRHRSHLGVMTKYAQSITQLDSMVDVTDTAMVLFDKGIIGSNDYTGLATNNQIKTGYRALWQGDFDANGKVKYGNPNDDLSDMLFDVLGNSGNVNGSTNYNFAYGYTQGDYDMDSKVKYDNPNDDNSYELSQLLNYPLNVNGSSNFDFFIQQLP